MFFSKNGNLVKDSAPYTAFARVYDSTMEDVPYIKWASYIHQALTRYGIESNSRIADFASGTGIIHYHLASIYPRLIGIDLSHDMLKGCANKLPLGSIQADICELPLADASIDAALCIHDSLNYLMNEDALSRHFYEASRVIRPGGLYIFDISTEYNVIQHYHSQTFQETHEGVQVLWSNHYDFQTRVITSILEFYQPPEKKGLRTLANKINRNWLKKEPHIREVHRQKIFTDETVVNLVEESGFMVVETIPDYGYYESAARAQLNVFVAQKK